MQKREKREKWSEQIKETQCEQKHGVQTSV